jgi:hypothetical protein
VANSSRKDRRNNTIKDGTKVVALPPGFGSLYAALFTFAHRALCAAAIRLCPVAEMVLFGFAVLILDQRFF